MSLFIGAVGVASAGAGLWSVTALQASLTKQDRLNDLANVQMNIDMMHDALRADVLIGLSTLEPDSQISLATVKTQFSDHAKNMQSLSGRASMLSTTEIVGNDIVNAVDEAQHPLFKYTATAREIIDGIDGHAAEAKAKLPDFLDQFHKLEDQLGDMGEKIQTAAGDQSTQLSEFANYNRLLMLGVLVFSVIAAALMGLMLRLQVINPLNKLVTVIRKLADGDVNVDPPGVRRGDELGMIARAVAIFRDHEITLRAEREEQGRAKLQADEDRRSAEAAAINNERSLVMKAIGGAMEKLARKDLTYRLKSDLPEAYRKLQGDFNDAIGAFERVIEKLSQSSSAITTGTREITTASDDLTQRTEMQAANLEETAAAVSDITNKVRATATGAGHAREVVSAAKNEAAQSGEIVRQAIDAMNSIEGSSKQITQIIGVIDEIAFQTNLLALNAGVEAARAGDAGRGFAVVAQEVRALAQRSAEAAKQIKTLIASSHAQVQHGVRLVGDTSTLLERIVRRVVEINDVVADIATGAADQAQSLGQVNSAVDSMDKATQQNAAMVEETTAATHQLAILSTELHDIVSTFAISGGTKPIMALKPANPVVAPKAASMAHSEPAQRTSRSLLGKTGTDDWSEF
ncbi:methyl-accepting chemotaxis protein [Aestuariivirga litoralis]|uniref:methyl-accepting chemotaxis protein n=1 Tax=Aestuariivirga litoralis TaxID=2650924 RepID=UPI0018C7AF9D|nr:methyl-accepting chemotaxis protein [Aestuariivirga litoralis]MBG1231796.1 HAMP domain-containing protein [Aestuariivirga litoralis]